MRRLRSAPGAIAVSFTVEMIAATWRGVLSCGALGAATGKAMKAASTIVTASERGAPDAARAWGIRVPRS
jgi:hypothetical protein